MNTLSRPQRKRRTQDTCSIEGCDGPFQARGWCNRHYQRWVRYGDPEAPTRPRGLHKGTTITVGDKSWSTAPKWKGVTCRWEGCPRPAQAFGLCLPHSNAAKFSKAREHMIPEEHRMERCTGPDCDYPVYNREKGLCRGCLQKEKRGTLYRQRDRIREEMHTPGDSTTIGGRIKNLRLTKGWTRQDLADRMGYEMVGAHSYMGRVERGETGAIEPKTIKRFADVLGVQVDYLVPLAMQPGPKATDGERLKWARTKAGLTLREAGARIGVSPEAVRQHELSLRISDKVWDKMRSVYPELSGSRRHVETAARDLFDQRLHYRYDDKIVGAPKELWATLGAALYGERDVRVRHLRGELTDEEYVAGLESILPPGPLGETNGSH